MFLIKWSVSVHAQYGDTFWNTGHSEIHYTVHTSPAKNNQQIRQDSTVPASRRVLRASLAHVWWGSRWSVLPARGWRSRLVWPCLSHLALNPQALFRSPHQCSDHHHCRCYCCYYCFQHGWVQERGFSDYCWKTSTEKAAKFKCHFNFLILTKPYKMYSTLELW